MQWTDEAVVLRIGKFRETDLWVRFLSRDRGLVTAFAFGGSKSRRRFTGCLDVFNVLSVSVASSRDGRFLNMREATLLEGPRLLRTDWRRQGMAANCVRFLEAMDVPPDSSRAAYGLVRELLHLLEGEGEPSPLTPLMFRFRLAAEQGYVPELSACSRCGAPADGLQQMHFVVGEGALCCPACRRPGDMSLSLGQEALDVLAKVKEYSPVAWSRLAPAPESARQAARLIDAFVRYHLGFEWINGRFKAM